MRFSILLTAALLTSMVGFDAEADTRDQFAGRVKAAFQHADKAAALKRLFFLDDVDPETLRTYETRIIGRMLAKYDNPTVAFEPLPSDFDPVQVIDGYEYRPNVELAGYLVLNGKTRVPFGLREGRHYITAMTRKAVNPGGPPDQLLQMMVIGVDSPPVRFEGHCDVMQSNGRLRRMKLRDNGHGNQTLAIMAQHIERCTITNVSGRGALSLTLTEGESEVFKDRIVAPDTEIRFAR